VSVLQSRDRLGSCQPAVASGAANHWQSTALRHDSLQREPDFSGHLPLASGRLHDRAQFTLLRYGKKGSDL